MIFAKNIVDSIKVWVLGFILVYSCYSYYWSYYFHDGYCIICSISHCIWLWIIIFGCSLIEMNLVIF